MASNYGMHFLETSAKEGTNVEATFATIARKIKDLMVEQVFMKSQPLRARALP